MVIKIDFTVIGEEKMHCAGCESRVRLAPVSYTHLTLPTKA